MPPRASRSSADEPLHVGEGGGGRLGAGRELERALGDLVLCADGLRGQAGAQRKPERCLAPHRPLPSAPGPAGVGEPSYLLWLLTAEHTYRA